METFSTLLTLCKGNPPVNDGFPLQRVGNVELWYFVVDIGLNKLLARQWGDQGIRYIELQLCVPYNMHTVPLCFVAVALIFILMDLCDILPESTPVVTDVTKWLARWPQHWLAIFFCGDYEVPSSKLALNAWSNSLILGLCLNASAWRHIPEAPPDKIPISLRVALAAVGLLWECSSANEATRKILVTKRKPCAYFWGVL